MLEIWPSWPAVMLLGEAAKVSRSRRMVVDCFRAELKRVFWRKVRREGEVTTGACHFSGFAPGRVLARDACCSVYILDRIGG